MSFERDRGAMMGRMFLQKRGTRLPSPAGGARPGTGVLPAWQAPGRAVPVFPRAGYRNYRDLWRSPCTMLKE